MSKAKKKGQFKFTAVATVTWDMDGVSIPKVKASDIEAKVDGLDKNVYVDGRGYPRKAALRPLSGSLLVGILTNIKRGQARGWWDGKEHLEWVIAQLKEGYDKETDDPVEGVME
jgi:hypothetical protein